MAVLVSACSSIKNPVFYYDKFDFSAVESYRFYDNNSPFVETLNIPYAQRSRIELAIEKELANQHLNYSEAGHVDIMVTYHLMKKSRKDYRKYNKFVRFCTHCLKANTWTGNGIPWQLYQDGLIVDLVDPKTKRSIWRSIYPLEIDVKDNSKQRNQVIVDAVHNMLSQYPKT